jgi:hypothetical protein
LAHNPTITVVPDTGVRNGKSRHAGTAVGQSAFVVQGEEQNCSVPTNAQIPWRHWAPPVHAAPGAAPVDGWTRQ